MSLSAQDRRSVWQEHKDSLTRIKTQLSDRRSPNVRAPVRSPAGQQGRQAHSPYGKYRTSTPPYLPRLETPPDKRSKANLRGNRYEVVPPVKESRRQPDSRSTDYDSWGESSDDEPEPDPGTYMPMQYGLPPQVVYGAPFGVYYPPPPPRQRQRRKRTQNENDYRQKSPAVEASRSRQPLGERYEDVNRSLPSKTKKRSKQNRVTFSQPDMPPAGGFYGYPAPYPAFMPYPQFYPGDYDPYSKKRDGRYKYIQPRDTPFSPSDVHGENIYQRFKDQPDQLLVYYMKDHPLFSENLVNYLVNQFLDDIIPDILIDALSEIGKVPGSIDNSMERVRDDVLATELPSLIHDVVRTTLNELVDEYMLYTESSADPLEGFLTRLLNDAVHEASHDVVRETVKEMARTYVDDKHHEVIYEDLFRDFMDIVGPNIVEECMFEVIAEDFIEDEVIPSELGEMLPEIATEVLTHYDTKVMRRELKEISSQAGDRLMEGLVMDYLFQLVARQGKVWDESDHSNKYMDDLMSSILLEKMMDVTVQRRKTVHNKPLKKIHQKVVTDIALDVCLQQLTASLDEDLADVDEYERGVIFPSGSHLNTPVNMTHVDLTS